MIFDLPLPLNLANSRMHWRTEHREKKNYWALLDVYQGRRLAEMAGFRIPPPPKTPIARATFRAVWYLHGKHMDQGNAQHRLKWIEDWLVTRGYLKDDTPECLTLEPPEQHTDRKNKRVEITITEEGQCFA